jgi:hypothetical protein
MPSRNKNETRRERAQRLADKYRTEAAELIPLALSQGVHSQARRDTWKRIEYCRRLERRWQRELDTDREPWDRPVNPPDE